MTTYFVVLLTVMSVVFIDIGDNNYFLDKYNKTVDTIFFIFAAICMASCTIFWTQRLIEFLGLGSKGVLT